MTRVTDPYYRDEQVTVYAGDCLDVMAQLPDASVDAVVTDPPYGLEFMGKEWDSFAPARTQYHGQRADTSKNVGDSGSPCRCEEPAWSYEQPAGTPTRMAAFQTWCELWAAECLRLLKPGGHLLAFGGTRTGHRLACAVEDAGFEIRDSIAWLYGSGFPKSLDVSKAIDKAAGAERETVGEGPFAARRPRADHASQGLTYADDAYIRPAGHALTAPSTDAAKQWQGWGTALKPAFEPIVVARKPLRGTVAANVVEHGTGALNINACRVGTDSTRRRNAAEMGYHGGNLSTDYQTGSGAGRWPTNVVIDEHTAAGIDKQSGDRPTGAVKPYTERHTNASSYRMERDKTFEKVADHGGASRFFPTFNGRDGEATAQQRYTEDGGTDFAVTPGMRREPGPRSDLFPTFRYEAKAPTAERPSTNGVAHPTVKPLDLMRWLVKLVTPTHGLVLDPFAGSGTTAEACIHEHMRCITIERETDYLPLIMARLSKPMAVGFDFEEPA